MGPGISERPSETRGSAGLSRPPRSAPGCPAPSKRRVEAVRAPGETPPSAGCSQSGGDAIKRRGIGEAAARAAAAAQWLHQLTT